MQIDRHRLHLTLAAGVSPEGPVIPRVYTLTHSDTTGELYLTVGPTIDRRQISGLYTRFMRDEVTAEWIASDDGATALRVHCHVSGGLVLGTARWRYGIFQSHMTLVLHAFRRGDQGLFVAHPELDHAAVRVHFHSHRNRYDLIEDWGRLGDYR